MRICRSSRPFRNRSTNNEDITDFRHFPYYRSPRSFDSSMFYTSVVVQINRENTSPTRKCAKQNYFRFGSAILEMDGGPPAGLGTVDLIEIGQQTTKIWPSVGWVGLDQSISTTLRRGGSSRAPSVSKRLPVCGRCPTSTWDS